MKTRIEIEIKPFTAPNVVLLKIPMGNGDETVSSIPLKEIDADTLDKLCDDFTEQVFNKACKSRPSKNAAEFADNTDQDLSSDTTFFPSKPNSEVD